MKANMKKKRETQRLERKGENKSFNLQMLKGFGGK